MGVGRRLGAQAPEFAPEFLMDLKLFSWSRLSQPKLYTDHTS